MATEKGWGSLHTSIHVHLRLCQRVLLVTWTLSMKVDLKKASSAKHVTGRCWSCVWCLAEVLLGAAGSEGDGQVDAALASWGYWLYTDVSTELADLLAECLWQGRVAMISWRCCEREEGWSKTAQVVANMVILPREDHIL